MIAATPGRYDAAALLRLEMDLNAATAQALGLTEAYRPVALEIRDGEAALALALPRHYRRGDPLSHASDVPDIVLQASGVDRRLIERIEQARAYGEELQRRIADAQAKAAPLSQLVKRCRAWRDGKTSA